MFGQLGAGVSRGVNIVPVPFCWAIVCHPPLIAPPSSRYFAVERRDVERRDVQRGVQWWYGSVGPFRQSSPSILGARARPLFSPDDIEMSRGLFKRPRSQGVDVRRFHLFHILWRIGMDGAVPACPRDHPWNTRNRQSPTSGVQCGRTAVPKRSPVLHPTHGVAIWRPDPCLKSGSVRV